LKSFKYLLAQILPQAFKARIFKQRRYFCEIIGSKWYSQPALNQLDQKLEKYMPYRNGFFIEAGANDGFAQSNTYYFEKHLGWQGILVEPIPELYRKCVRQRPKSIVFNCALVSADYEDETVKMMYSNLMSLVKGARKSEIADLEHIRRGMQIQKLEETYEIEVPARTLTSILDKVNIEKIDILSLDVEGYELNALRGFDFSKYQPKYILVETNFRDEIDEHLIASGYSAIDEFTARDIFYAKVN
jgi:FkbM family methyltransferase